MKLTPIKFDVQYHDGLLEIDGMAFDWKGMQFAVHATRPLYRFEEKEPLTVSHVGTGFGCSSGLPRTCSAQTAARNARKRLERAGEAKVREAIEKGGAIRNSTRLTE